MNLAALPGVHEVLEQAPLTAARARVDHALLVAEIRSHLERCREALAAGQRTEVPAAAAVAEAVAAAVDSWDRPALQPVINLTGTLLHTNLGRAPLSAEAVEAVARAAAGANIEYDLSSGRRGDRDHLVEGLLRRLTGAEAATVVNNNAAAVYLALNTLANRRRVVVSRGELVEIGGSFRMPDIVRKSGCRLVEVGTTNRTHLGDYRRALEEGGRLLLKVHTSNYRVVGFTREVSVGELAALGRELDVPVMVDLGSGALMDLARWGLEGEPLVAETLAAGADVVTFSGDKLLGGPQAGIVLGRSRAIARIKRNPMKRALRCGKLTLAALEATLRAYLSPETLAERLPAYRMIARGLDDLDALAGEIAPHVERWAEGRARVELIDGDSQVGSGALPGAALPTRLIALTPLEGSPSGLARELRALSPPVIGRVHSGKVLLDLRGLLGPEALIRALEQSG
ncbi:MAG: L-seryl-tRNA(Sec) selenium transferase [Gammaproteobacteria bacterium]|nr:L-seryl-tRNA(Sec) selenium transferase [Gammaproteobacteria bacterium]